MNLPAEREPLYKYDLRNETFGVADVFDVGRWYGF